MYPYYMRYFLKRTIWPGFVRLSGSSSCGPSALGCQPAVSRLSCAEPAETGSGPACQLIGGGSDGGPSA